MLHRGWSESPGAGQDSLGPRTVFSEENGERRAHDVWVRREKGQVAPHRPQKGSYSTMWNGKYRMKIFYTLRRKIQSLICVKDQPFGERMDTSRSVGSWWQSRNDGGLGTDFSDGNVEVWLGCILGAKLPKHTSGLDVGCKEESKIPGIGLSSWVNRRAPFGVCTGLCPCSPPNAYDEP